MLPHALHAPAPLAGAADSAVVRWVAHPRLDVLKLVAVASMLIDHLNTICLGTRFWELRTIGRLAFPLFAFVLAFNLVRHTHNPARFIARLMTWGVLSQPIYWYALSVEMLNIFFTLGFGLLAAELFRRGVRAAIATVVSIGLVVISRFHAPIADKLDFGIEGIAVVFIFAQLIEQPTWWRGVLAVLFTAALNVDLNPTLQLVYALGALLGLGLVALTAHWPGEWRWVRRIRLGFYFFYPAHLFVLKVLAQAAVIR
jgi:hypothetical protein